MDWIHENPARWDADKARIIGEAAPGIFDSRLRDCQEGALVPCDWWRVEEAGRPVGYGWLDVSWGDAEILLATAADAHGRGVGSFIIDQLEREAEKRGLRYLCNMVRATHPDREKVAVWLGKRGFQSCEDGRLLRAVVPRTS